MIRIASPYAAATSPPAASAPKPAAAPPPAQDPKDVPPELVIQAPEPPTPLRKGWRRVAVPVLLGASLAGVVVPIAVQQVHNHGIDGQISALQSTAKPAELRTDLPARRLPAPEVAAGQGGARLSPDGRMLVTDTPEREGRLVVVGTEDGRVISRMEGVRNGAFLADGSLLSWTKGAEGRIELRDPATGQVRGTVAAPGLDVPSLAPAGGRAAYVQAGNQGSALHLVEVREGALVERTLPLGAGALQVGPWSADGSRVTAVRANYREENGRVVLVDARSGEKLLDQDMETTGVSLSRDGSLLAIGGTNGHGGRWGGQVRVTDASGRTLWERRGFGRATFSSGDDGLILGSTGDAKKTVLERVEPRTGKTLWTAYAPNGDSYGANVQLSPDGSRIAVSSRYALYVLDAGTGKTLWGRQMAYEPRFAFSPDGSRVAMAEWVAGATRDQGRHVVSILDGTTGRMVAQQAGEEGAGAPAFSANGQVLLVPTGSYYSQKLQLIDVANSPVSLDTSTRAQAEVKALVDRMLDGGLSDEARKQVHERLDGLPLEVVRAVAEGGTRILAVSGEPASQVSSVDLDARYADADALRSLADRSFADADAGYRGKIADLESRLGEARENARKQSRGWQSRLDVDPAILDQDVQRLTSSLWEVRQQRAMSAFTHIDAGSGGRLEPLAATSRQPVTLESIARDHGARTPAEVERFTALMQALNGPRLEQAQQKHLDTVRSLYPAAGLPTLPVEQRPFMAEHADLVVPSYAVEGGRAISGADSAQLKALGSGAGAARFENGNVVVTESGLKDDAAVRRTVGRAYEAAMRQRDPKRFAEFETRWRTAWWNANHYSDAASRPTPSDYFAQRFAEYFGPGRAEMERNAAEAARLVQNAVEAGTRQER